MLIQYNNNSSRAQKSPSTEDIRLKPSFFVSICNIIYKEGNTCSYSVLRGKCCIVLGFKGDILMAIHRKMVVLIVFVGFISSVQAGLFGPQKGSLDAESAFSRDVDNLINKVKRSSGAGLNIFELSQFVAIFVAETAHEIVFDAYKRGSAKPSLISITDPAYTVAHSLLTQAVLSRLRPNDLSSRAIVQAVNDVANKDISAIYGAVVEALSISNLKKQKQADLTGVQKDQLIESLRSKVTDLEKNVTQAVSKKTETKKSK